MWLMPDIYLSRRRAYIVVFQLALCNNNQSAAVGASCFQVVFSGA